MGQKFKQFTKLPCAQCGLAACKRFSGSGPLVVKSMIDTFWCKECGRLLCEQHRHAHTCERHEAKKETLAAMAPEKLKARMEEENKRKAAAEEAAKAPQRAAVIAADERRRRRYALAEKANLVAEFVQLTAREEGRPQEESRELLSMYTRANRLRNFLWNEYDSPTLPNIAEEEWRELKLIYARLTEMLAVVLAVPANGNWEEPDEWVEIDMINYWEDGYGEQHEVFMVGHTLAEVEAAGRAMRREATPPRAQPREPEPAAPAAPAAVRPDPQALLARLAREGRDAPPLGGVPAAADSSTDGPSRGVVHGTTEAPAPIMPLVVPPRPAQQERAPPEGYRSRLGKRRRPGGRGRDVGGRGPLAGNGVNGSGAGGHDPIFEFMSPGRGTGGEGSAGKVGKAAGTGDLIWKGKGLGKGTSSSRPTAPRTGTGPASVVAPSLTMDNGVNGSGAGGHDPIFEFMSPGRGTGGTAPLEAKPKETSSSKKKGRTPVLCLWRVVGGADKGGIVVRDGEDLVSALLDRLATGALVEELETRGDRLRFHKLEGEGPNTGWVSIRLKGKELLQKASLVE